MVFTAAEEKEIQDLKHSHKMAFESVRHTNAMEELNKQLEIAKTGGEK